MLGMAYTIWHIKEETQAGYVMSKFETPHFPLDGNVGLRVVATSESVDGNQTVPNTALQDIYS